MSKPTETEGDFDERLVCTPVSLSYDFRSHTGQLRLVDGHCCDMTGCLDIFRGIDPEVTTVKTFSGEEADTIYRKMGTEWEAFTPR